jgi:RNA polymerase sigma-70 factor (ECF subfamily)
VLEPASESADPKPTAVDELLRAEMLSTGYAALETLEFGRRAVFILYELDGCSMQEIAVALGIPVNTAYSRLRLAREQFQASLARMRLARGMR